MPASLEVELKFRAESQAPLDALATLERLGPASLGGAIEVDEWDRYLDTADGRLSKALWACRLRETRSSTVVSLKGPPDDQTMGALHRRPEIEGPAGDDLDTDDWPPSDARDFLLHLSGGAPLEVRLALRQLRIQRPASTDGKLIATLTLDCVQVMHDGIERGRLFVVELELTPDAVKSGLDPAPLVAALTAIPGLTAEPHTKLERALALLPHTIP